jgi:hypothetical protein
MSRVFAREASMKLAGEGMRWIIGAAALGDREVAELENKVGLPALYRAQAGLVHDMDQVADVLYGRAAA